MLPTVEVKLKLVRTLNLNMTLGECLIWDDQLGRLWWTDIERGRLYRMDGLEGEPIIYPMPSPVASFALTLNHDKLLLALKDGLGVFDIKRGTITRLCHIEESNPLTRLNDGRADRYGNFWVGSMYIDPTDDCPATGKLYVYRGGSDLSVFRSNIQLSNGLAFSADRQFMYFTDTKLYSIEQYELDQKTGLPCAPKLFAAIPHGEHADGACTDELGCLWNANWGKGYIRRYDNTGALLLEHKLSSNEATCLTFAGAKLDHLCVVTAQLGTNTRSSKSDGCLLIFKTNVTGVPEGRFAGELSWN